MNSPSVDIPLDQFLSEVNKHNTRADGSVKDPRLLARMDNPICKGCHELYKMKYPGLPFKIKCRGIYDQEDYQLKQDALKAKFPDEDPSSLDEIREIYDISFWASRHIVVKDDHGNLVPFVARWYQEETLRCTARHKVDRWGRGLGKTTAGVIEELHKVSTIKNYDVMVVCPADSQSEKWYTEILLQVESSPSLRNSLANKKQQPFKFFRFHNGSTISIFTAGSASGRGANTIRSQSPRRTRLEEQDYLADKDYEAIDPLINRYWNSEFHGSSTPTGARSKFWEMCVKFPRYREFYFPISVHPEWGPEKEEDCMRECKTMDRYRHEYMAEFGDPAQGVFKGIFIDRAKVAYSDPQRPSLKSYDTCQYDASKRYMMGVDWNGEGTGTRIRVVEYDPNSRMRRCVAKQTIDEQKWTTTNSIEAIKIMNKKWHCEKVYIDKGFGQAQDELIRLAGLTAPKSDPDTRRLKDIVPIDFGAKLTTNKLVPMRDANSKYTEDSKKEELERPTKPFMVEGAVMAFENGLFEFATEGDDLLDEQLRAYRIKSWSSHGYPSSYSVDGDCGDHDLDALMLALLAVEMTYGMFQTKEQLRRLISIAHVDGWGLNPVTAPSYSESSPSRVDQQRERSGIPTRNTTSKNDEFRMMYLMRGGAAIAPNRTSRNNNGGSRTAIFRKPAYQNWQGM